MPALSGEAAVEHLKSVGGYGSLAEAMAASRLKVREDAGGAFWAVNSVNRTRARFDDGRVSLESTREEAARR